MKYINDNIKAIVFIRLGIVFYKVTTLSIYELFTSIQTFTVTSPTVAATEPENMEVEETSTNPATFKTDNAESKTGFGYISKQPETVKPFKAAFKPLENAKPAATKDVYIWSDVDSSDSSTEDVVTAKIKVISPKSHKKKRKKGGASPKPEAKASQSRARESRHDIKILQENEEDVDDSDDNDLIVHEPVSAKKPFVFNIKLANPDQEQEEETKPKKKKDSTKEENEAKSENKAEESFPAKGGVKAESNSTGTAVSPKIDESGDNDATKTASTNNFALTPAQSQLMQSFNPFFSMQLMPDGTMITHPMYPSFQFMNFSQANSFISMNMGYSASLPDEVNSAPLPEYST